jgi:hypothetical protein
MTQSVGERIAEDWACGRLTGTVAEAIDAACAKAKAFAAPQWQPIETAPKDETILDLWAEEGRFPECWWSGERWISYYSGNVETPIDEVVFAIKNPTHWMPLPPCPSE